MRARQVVTVISLVAAALATPAAAVVDRLAVTIRVYDTAQIGTRSVDRALAAADASLASALVEARWVRCPAREPAAACRTPLRPSELTVRIVRTGPVDRSGIHPLGEAMIAPLPGGGVLATVFVDRVRGLARSAGTDAETLIGRAIAHEIGHLLLATRRHHDYGIMRAVWSRDELRRDLAGDWRFTPEDVALLQSRTSRHDRQIARGTQ